MRKNPLMKILALMFAFTLVAAACGSDDEETTPEDTEATEEAPETTEAMEESPETTEAMEEGSMEEGSMEEGAMADSAEICDAEGLVEAVESGPDEGTLDGMTDDPVATAASSNPVLTTLVSAVTEAGLVDTLNNAEALTVFAPTDCAFAEFDQETLEAAMADPTGLLTTVLGYHVVAGEQLSSDDLAEMSELTTFTEETLEVEVAEDGTVMVGGQATVQVPDISTANATVHLIDAVMVPPSAS